MTDEQCLSQGAVWRVVATVTGPATLDLAQLYLGDSPTPSPRLGHKART